MGFVEAEDSSEEPVRQTFGYGATNARDGNHNHGNLSLSMVVFVCLSLCSTNGQTPYVIFKMQLQPDGETVKAFVWRYSSY